jgi:small-conductance mechanosensitive channel
MNDVLARLGLTPPTTPDLIATGTALLVLVAAWAIAWLAGRQIGPSLVQLWERRAGERNHALRDRICGLVRDLVAALILAVALRVAVWPGPTHFLFCLGLATAVALLAYGFIRGLHLPVWAAGALAVFFFLAILTDAMRGVEPITRILGEIGVTIADRRITLLDLVQIAITLLILFAIVRLASRVINHSIRHARRLDPTQQLLAQKLVGVGLLVGAFFIGIDIVGIDLTALAVFSGAVGLAVGFGLQKTFGNLIAGIILLMDRSIKPGDVIVVGDSFGHVTKIGVRAVSVVTRDGKEHLIPNENLMTQEVENWSYSSKDVRVHIPVGVSYQADLPTAQRLMIEAARSSARVLDDPAPTVWLRAFGESSVDHDILVWISDPEAGVGNVQSEVLNRLWTLFKEHGVELPYPQRDIHVKDWPAAPGGAG